MNEFNFEARYTAPEFRGIALVPIRYGTRDVPVLDEVPVDGDGNYDPEGTETETFETGESEAVEDRDWMVVVMVGDNREHLVETSELTPVENYGGCGQIGCGHEPQITGEAWDDGPIELLAAEPKSGRSWLVTQ